MRQAQLSDIPQLQNLVEDAYRGGRATVSWKNEHDLVVGPRTSVEELTRIISSPESVILIKTEEGKLAACICVEKHGADVHLGLISVSPDYQNRGLARALITAGEAYGKAVFGCAGAVMWVLSGRDELLKFYNRCGYEQTGETEPFPPPEAGVTAIDTKAHFRVIRKSLLG
jgi:GNAT superfamily N-acetyltransferase